MIADLATSLRRVLILEDQTEIRLGLERLIKSDSRLSLVASCKNLKEANETIERGLLFEIALVDLGLPDGSGIDFISQLRQHRPDCASVVFTQLDTDEAIFGSLTQGAQGYILKSAPQHLLVGALIEASSGGAPMTPSIARRVLASFSIAKSNLKENTVDLLSERERDVLSELSQGHTYVEIAQQLGITLSTVQTFIKRIYQKLNVSNKAEASVLAERAGLS